MSFFRSGSMTVQHPANAATPYWIAAVDCFGKTFLDLLLAGAANSELATKPVVMTTMRALASVTGNSTPLSGPSYGLCFPVLEAVLMSSVHTSLHDQALQVLALHVAPTFPFPRKETLAVLFHVLGDGK